MELAGLHHHRDSLALPFEKTDVLRRVTVHDDEVGDRTSSYNSRGARPFE